MAEIPVQNVRNKKGKFLEQKHINAAHRKTQISLHSRKK